MTSTPTSADVPRIVILGSDAALGVRPSTAVQLAHACLQAGYALAVPATWGDELVAAECVRQLGSQASGTCVLCSCPLVRHRLLASGAELAPFLVSLVAPPVATARYVRAVASQPVRVHFVGTCPSGGDQSIDRWIDPDDFVDMLVENGIDVASQPTSFEGVLPPDRRRYWSLPGGFPEPDRLWADGGQRKRVEPDPEQELANAIAEQLLSRELGLLDLAPTMHCACSGVVTGIPPRTARARVLLTEPPRSPSPVVDHSVVVDLVVPVEVPRLLEERSSPSHPPAPPMTQPGMDSVRTIEERKTVSGIRLSGESSAPRRRASGATAVRPSPTSVPVSRRADGRIVPRAYAAHRRLTPPGTAHTNGHRREEGESPAIDPVSELLEGDSSREPRASPALGITMPAGD